MTQTTRERERSATRTVAAATTGSSMKVRQSAVGLVRGERVTVGQAMVGAIMARGDVTLSQGGARSSFAMGDMRIHQGGGGMFVAGGEAEIHQGGVGTMISLGNVRIEQGGTVVSAARRLEAGPGSWVGVALTPSLVAAPGSRVLMGPGQAMVAGAAAGGVIAAILLLARAVRSRP
jgi:hypothetical protein